MKSVFENVESPVVEKPAASPPPEATASQAKAAASAAPDPQPEAADKKPGTSAGPPPAAAPTPEQIQAAFEHERRIVDEYLPGVLLHLIAKRSTGKMVSEGGFKKSLDQFVSTLGNSHPVAKMLAEQLSWSHYGVANLLAGAACTESPALLANLSAVACRMMTENRQTGLALIGLGSQGVESARSVDGQASHPNSQLGSNLQGGNDGGSTSADRPSNRGQGKQSKAGATNSARPTAAA